MMIRLERTFDLALVAEVMTHPRVYPWIADDFYPAPENFAPMDNRMICYLLAYEGEQLLGLCITHPVNSCLWEAHHCFLPHAWGQPAAAVGEAFFDWLWKHTQAQACFGMTPGDNKLALRFAVRKLGMTESGRIPRALQRGGVLQDLVVFTRTRPHAAG